MHRQTELITTRSGAAALAADWSALLARSDADSIFLTPEWALTWLDVVHPGAPLCVAALRDAGQRLVGLAPLYRAPMRLCRALPTTALRAIGDQLSGAEYGDFICDRNGAPEIGAALLAALQTQRDWDFLYLPNVADWTGATQRLQQTLRAPQRCALHARPREFAYTALPPDVDGLWKLLSGNARSTLRRQMRRLGDAATLETCTDPTALPSMLSALFDLHEARWSSAGQRGSFARKPRMQAFYEAFAPLALQRGWLRLYALRVGERVVAVQYGYAYGGVYHQMQEGYAPDAPEGAGNVLRIRAMEAAIAEGLRGYDFLGGYSEHKRRWGATLRSGQDLMLVRAGVRRLPLRVRAIWPTGRFLRELPLPGGGASGVRGCAGVGAVSEGSDSAALRASSGSAQRAR